eukprot:COSAG03_NODE_1220_length_4535_cov_9.671776_6_plen_53_part_00
MMRRTCSPEHRYVQLNDLGVQDVDHNKEADWEVGLYQVSVYGHDTTSMRRLT